MGPEETVECKLKSKMQRLIGEVFVSRLVYILFEGTYYFVFTCNVFWLDPALYIFHRNVLRKYILSFYILHVAIAAKLLIYLSAQVIFLALQRTARIHSDLFFQSGAKVYFELS